MKRCLTTTALILALAAPSFAGGPVLEDMTEIAPAPKHDRKIGGLVVGLIAIAALIALAGGSDACTTEETVPTPEGC